MKIMYGIFIFVITAYICVAEDANTVDVKITKIAVYNTPDVKFDDLGKPTTLTYQKDMKNPNDIIVNTKIKYSDGSEGSPGYIDVCNSEAQDDPVARVMVMKLLANDQNCPLNKDTEITLAGIFSIEIPTDNPIRCGTTEMELEAVGENETFADITLKYKITENCQD